MTSDVRIGIMVNPSFGVSDTGEPALMFQLRTDDGYTSSHWVWDMNEVGNIIKTAGVSDVPRLHGRPCWYRKEDGFCRFLGPLSYDYDTTTPPLEDEA